MGALGPEQTLLVTGAGGYIGRATVQAALARGHRVKAVLRPDATIPSEIDGAEIVFADIATDDQILVAALKGVDAVIHAAGSFNPVEEDMRRDTIVTSQILLNAIQSAGVMRVVLVGSMTVYDYLAAQDGAPIDEDTLLEGNPSGRDAYCRIKTEQEALFQQAGGSLDVSILRVGAVWGPDRLFNAHLGPSIGPMMLRIGCTGELPLCHIDLCASALTMAAEKPCAVVNVLDMDRPDRLRFLKAVRACGWPRMVMPLPYWLMMSLAKITPVQLRKIGVLHPETLAQRYRPIRFSNKRLQGCLEGVTKVSFETAMYDAVTNSSGQAR